MHKTTLSCPCTNFGYCVLRLMAKPELRVAIMRNSLESGVERTKREKGQKKTDSIKVERKVKKIQARK